MFIPPGTTIHDSLATSYVLVDALVADLCEGGFSGLVEVVLRDTDSFIIIASGDVAAVVEKQGVNVQTKAAGSYTRTTVKEIGERSRRERGRVSVHGYSAAIAKAVAGCINAQPLYVGLSTEFTDLEKMISKLLRESDREWFIEVGAEDGPTALIHMRDAVCRIIRPIGDTNSGALELASNAELKRLVDECNRAGSTFDVYFGRPAEAIEEPVERLEAGPEFEPNEPNRANGGPAETDIPSFPTPSASLVSNELFLDSSLDLQRVTVGEFGANGVEGHALSEVSNNSVAASVARSLATIAEVEPPDRAPDSIEPHRGDLAILLDEIPPPAAGAEDMAEIKRLMGEIARAIEEAGQAVGRRDSFSMSLRAGQLKIADRFPFLDPFAGDFEYLAGEIVFVGQAPAEEFIAGLTEALRLAIEAVMHSTAYADRFRSYVAEDLQKLLVRDRAEFEKFGLDQVIQEINTSLQ